MHLNAVIIVLVLTAALPALAQTHPAAQRVNAQQLVRQLADEARAALGPDAKFPPRDKPDVAASVDGTLSSPEVVRILQRKLDRDPLVDAYVKWQLLSFEPNLSGLSAREAMRVVDALPELPVQGRVDPRHDRLVQNYGNKPNLPDALIKQFEVIVADFNKEQATIAERIKPNYAYREHVLKEVAQVQGVEFPAMFKDAEQRVRAGDKFWNRSVQDIVEKAKAIKSDPAYPAGLRSALQQKLQQLNQMRTERITSFTIKAGNEVIARIQTVQVGPKRFDEARAYINGREPPKK